MADVIDTNTEREFSALVKAGVERVRLLELDTRLEVLGYEREPDSRCAGIAKNMTTGNTYKCVTWSVRERDTKQSAYHYQSRRDARFKKMQQLRQAVFVYARGCIITI